MPNRAVFVSPNEKNLLKSTFSVRIKSRIGFNSRIPKKFQAIRPVVSKDDMHINKLETGWDDEMTKSRFSRISPLKQHEP